MAKRLIGIDIDGQVARIAVASEEKGITSLRSLHQGPCDTDIELARTIEEAIGDPRLGDRMATALPAKEAFIRWLKFPFSDEKKIAAALPLDFSLQLPVSSELCTTTFEKPIPDAEGYQVTAAAVKTESIQTFLAPFEQQGIALNTLDIAPFAYARGLKTQWTDGILIVANRGETTVSLLSGGNVASYRLLPKVTEDNIDSLSALILKTAASLPKKTETTELPLILIGNLASSALLERLRKGTSLVETPSIILDGKPIDPEFIIAAALALRAGVPDKERGFNLRHGEFSLKSEWGLLKKRLITVAVLVALCATTLSLTAYLNYSQKNRYADALQQEMVHIYRETFPNSPTIVDVPLQMRSSITELQKLGRLIGATATTSPLAVLAEISRLMPEDLEVDVNDFNYTPDAIRLEGFTTSFEAINRLAKSLGQSELFIDAQVADAKMSVTGGRVDFRINLSLRKEP